MNEYVGQLIADLGSDPLEAALRMRVASGSMGSVRIGYELFSIMKQPIVAEARNMGFEVFLDLKFADGPEMVYFAVGASAHVGAEICSIHLDAGEGVVRTARSAGLNYGVAVIGDTLSDCARDEGDATRVLRQCKTAIDNQIMGVMVDALYVHRLRRELGQEFVIIAVDKTPEEELKGDFSELRAILENPQNMLIVND